MKHYTWETVERLDRERQEKQQVIARPLARPWRWNRAAKSIEELNAMQRFMALAIKRVK